MDEAPLHIFHDRCRAGKLAYTVDETGRPIFPPRPGLAWRESAGAGTVYATTTVRRRDAEPRDLSLIDLDEGFRIMARVEGVAPGEVRPGLRVALDFAPGDPPLPIFRPA